jgi:acyl-CoA thioester hydrolase
MQRDNFKHLFEDNVRWGDCDMLGHVNNTLFLRYIESARIAYISDILGTELVSNGKETWILADLHCAFLKQLIYPCNFIVGSRISKIGNSSATLKAALFREGDKQPTFTSTAIMVWFDTENQRPLRIDDKAREAIKRYETMAVEGL